MTSALFRAFANPLKIKGFRAFLPRASAPRKSLKDIISAWCASAPHTPIAFSPRGEDEKRLSWRAQNVEC